MCRGSETQLQVGEKKKLTVTIIFVYISNYTVSTCYEEQQHGQHVEVSLSLLVLPVEAKSGEYDSGQIHEESDNTQCSTRHDPVCKQVHRDHRDQ